MTKQPDSIVEFSCAGSDCRVKIEFTRLENGFGFRAADKTTKWLLVTNTDLNCAIHEVCGQLKEILGGDWFLSRRERDIMLR